MATEENRPALRADGRHGRGQDKTVRQRLADARFWTAVFLRLVSIVMFAVGIGYWASLTGIETGSLARFDLLPLWWRIAAPALAVLYPVAGIGLWLLAGWGTVLWVLVALVEALMHLGFAELFGRDILWLAAHAGGLAVLALLRIVSFRQVRASRA